MLFPLFPMNNQEQYKLLKKDPKKLLATNLYQQKITQVVNKLVYRYHNKDFVKDLIQDLNIIFLNKQMNYIRNNYELGAGLLILYFEKAVYNKCKDLLKKQFSSLEGNFEGLDSFQAISNSKFMSPEMQFIQKELVGKEVQKIEIYFKLSLNHKNKLLLLLKAFCRILLTEQDFNSYNSQLPPKIVKKTLLFFSNDYSNETDKTVYEHITPIINLGENKITTPDAVRKWLDDKLKEIIQTLNYQNAFSYNKESLKNLLQIAFNSSLVNY